MNYEFDWGVLFRAEYRDLILTGMLYTLIIAGLSTLLSTLLGTFLAAARLAHNHWFNWPAEAWVTLARHIPGVFWVLFFYFAFPELLPQSWTYALNGWIHFALLSGIIALTIDNATYVSDIVRTGVLAIPRGEREAAKCCGLNPWQEWTCCLLPVMVRIVTPPLANRTIHNFKNSSLCMVIGVQEMTWATQQIESLTFRGIEVTIVATAFYVMLATSLGTLARRLEKRTNRHWQGTTSVWQRERLNAQGYGATS